MSWGKRYIGRPFYIFLYVTAWLWLTALLVALAVCLGRGFDLSKTYAVIKPMAIAGVNSYLYAYYIKWQYVYGPQKKQELKNANP